MENKLQLKMLRIVQDMGIYKRIGSARYPRRKTVDPSSPFFCVSQTGTIKNFPPCPIKPNLFFNFMELALHNRDSGAEQVAPSDRLQQEQRNREG